MTNSATPVRIRVSMPRCPHGAGGHERGHSGTTGTQYNITAERVRSDPEAVDQEHGGCGEKCIEHTGRARDHERIAHEAALAAQAPQAAQQCAWQAAAPLRVSIGLRYPPCDSGPDRDGNERAEARNWHASPTTPGCSHPPGARAPASADSNRYGSHGGARCRHGRTRPGLSRVPTPYRRKLRSPAIRERAIAPRCYVRRRPIRWPPRKARCRRSTNAAPEAIGQRADEQHSHPVGGEVSGDRLLHRAHRDGQSTRDRRQRRRINRRRRQAERIRCD